MQKYSNPWEHIIIDNYYDPVLLQQAQNELVQYIQSNPPKERMTYINSLDSLPNVQKCVNSNPITNSWLSNFTHFRQHSKLKARNQVIICVGECSFDIHYESPSKILSAVTYLWSNNGTGTVLYDKDKNYVKEIELATNRTLIFCGEDNVTWHSYYSKPESIRITLNTFLEQT